MLQVTLVLLPDARLIFVVYVCLFMGCFNPQRATYAVVCETLKFKPVIDDVLALARLQQLVKVRTLRAANMYSEVCVCLWRLVRQATRAPCLRCVLSGVVLGRASGRRQRHTLGCVRGPVRSSVRLWY